MNSVLLIGNDNVSTRDHELGELIDSHDSVVRFGWYDTRPENKKYLGSKTDVWATSLYDPIRAKLKYDYIFQYGFLQQGHADPVYKQIDKQQMKEFGSSTVYRPFSRIWLDMDNYMTVARGGFRQMYETPDACKKYSSALTLAWVLLHEGGEDGMLGCYRGPDGDSEIPKVEQVSLYGFDWWGMSKNAATSVDGPKIGKNWAQQLELGFFGTLWMNGKIHDLNPDSDFHHAPIK